MKSSRQTFHGHLEKIPEMLNTSASTNSLGPIVPFSSRQVISQMISVSSVTVWEVFSMSPALSAGDRGSKESGMLPLIDLPISG
jgi:hypothetical protein